MINFKRLLSLFALLTFFVCQVFAAGQQEAEPKLAWDQARAKIQSNLQSSTGQSLSTDGVQTQLLLSPQDALTLALKRNRDLANLRMDKDFLTRSTSNQWFRLLPQLSASARLNDEFIKPQAAGPSLDIGGRLTWSFNPLDLPKGVERSQAKLALEEESLINAITYQTYSSFYALDLAGLKTQLAAQSLAQSQASLTRVQRNFNSGYVSRVEVLEAERQVLLRQIELEALKSNETALMQSFAFLLGLPVHQSFALKSKDQVELQVPEIPEPGLLPLRVWRAYWLLQDQVEDNQRELWDLAPQLSFGLVGTWPWLSLPESPQALEGALNWDIGLSFNLSALLPYSTQQEAIEQGNRRFEDLRRDYQSMLEELPVQLEQRRQAFFLEASRVALSERSLEIARQSYELAQRNYASGVISDKDLQEYRLEFETAQLALWDARYKNWDSAWALIRAYYQ